MSIFYHYTIIPYIPFCSIQEYNKHQYTLVELFWVVSCSTLKGTHRCPGGFRGFLSGDLDLDAPAVSWPRMETGGSQNDKRLMKDLGKERSTCFFL